MCVGDTVKNICEAIQMGLVTQSPERMTNASEVGATRLDKQRGQRNGLKEQGIVKPRCDNLMHHSGGDAGRVFKRKAGVKGLQNRRIDLWRRALFKECAGRKNPRDGTGNVKKTTKTEVRKC